MKQTSRAKANQNSSSKSAKSAKKQTAPETAPEQTAPETAPEQTAPEQTAPEQTAPEQTAPEQTAPAAPTKGRYAPATSKWAAGEAIDPQNPFGVTKYGIMRWMGAEGFSYGAAEAFMTEHNITINASALADRLKAEVLITEWGGRQNVFGAIPVLTIDAVAYMDKYRGIQGERKLRRKAGAAPAEAIAA